jgi:hypothetical protein
MTSNSRTDRRRFMGGGLLATAAWLGRRAFAAAQPPDHSHHRVEPTAAPGPQSDRDAVAAADRDPQRTSVATPARAGRPPGSVVETPDVPHLPWRLVDGVKEFHLICDVVRSRFLPWREPFNVWGYNGSMPGPTIEVNEGDRVRFVVENRLPEPTSMHWHGLEVPQDMDGVPGLGQDLIPPGGMYVYEFTLRQHGTFFYHSHLPMQEMMGMIGLFVIHPRTPYTPRVDRDFGLVFQEWAILPNNQTPNTLAMEFNWLTINGKVGPATTPMLVKQGERVRLRMVNLGMDHHPIHLHGHQFEVVGSEAGRIPRSAWEPGNTVLLGVAQARDVEFDAAYLGDWMVHCHLPHHMMNHMVSMVGPHSDPGGHTAATSDARRVPGYPQDMFVVIDEPFADLPEYWGLRPGWSGGMMGMMTMVRVLPPELFDAIGELRERKRADPGMVLPSPPPRAAFLGAEPRSIDPAPFAARYRQERS